MLPGASKNNSQKHGARMQDDASSSPPSSPEPDYQQKPETLERKALGVCMQPGEESNLFCFPQGEGRARSAGWDTS